MKMMRTSLTRSELAIYLKRQVENSFPDPHPVAVDGVVERALNVLEYRFSKVRLNSYRDAGGPRFNHLHSDQYASFLYECSRIAFREFGDRVLAEKLFGLNKALNGIVCMYDTELPRLFLMIHTVGTVLGKATYGEKFVVCQGVTVGTDRGKAPKIGEGVVVFGGSTIVGDTTLGDGCVVAAGTIVRNRHVGMRHVVAGREPDIIVKPSSRELARDYFDP